MKRDFNIFTGLLKAARKDDELMLTGIASSTIKDRHGDVMTPRALESMLRSAEGMTIYLNHSYNVPEDVAGTVRQAWINKSDDELHDLHFQIAINQENPRAVQAFNAIDKGTKLGLSIGAMIPEGGAKKQKNSSSFIIDDVELLETSIVSIPANPRSWVEYARKSLLLKSDIPTEDDDPEEMEDGAPDDDMAVKAMGDHDHAEHHEEDVEAEHETAHADDGLCDEDCCCGGIGPIGVCPDCRCSANPDLAKAKVTVWPSGKVSVDTEPKTEGGDTPASEGEPQDNQDPIAEALRAMNRDATVEVGNLLEPTVIASLQTTRDLLAALVDVATKAVDRAEKAEAERSEMAEAVKRLNASTEQFIARVSAYPRGRRALAKEASKSSASLQSIKETGMFADDFIDIIQKGL